MKNYLKAHPNVLTAELQTPKVKKINRKSGFRKLFSTSTAIQDDPDEIPKHLVHHGFENQVFDWFEFLLI